MLEVKKPQLVYVAIDSSDGEVFNVNTNRDDCEKFVMDWFGINPDGNYTAPSIYYGFTKIEYREIEGDLEGYWIFVEDGKNYRVDLWCKCLNEGI